MEQLDKFPVAVAFMRQNAINPPQADRSHRYPPQAGEKSIPAYPQMCICLSLSIRRAIEQKLAQHAVSHAELRINCASGSYSADKALTMSYRII